MTRKPFPTPTGETPANAGNDGGGGNRTRAAFPTQTGVIYVIQSEGGGPVKIGYCEGRSRLRSRLRSLQTGSPYKLAIVHLEDGTRADELALHRRFQPLRLVGEWFTPSYEVAERFPSIQYEYADVSERSAMYDRGFQDGWERGYDDAAPCDRCGVSLCECPETRADVVREEKILASLAKQRYHALHGSTRGMKTRGAA